MNKKIKLNKTLRYIIIVAIFFFTGFIIDRNNLIGSFTVSTNFPLIMNSKVFSDYQRMKNPSSKTNEEVKTAIFYINDAHGYKVDRLKTASDTFSRNFQTDLSVDSFKLSGGDINIGSDKKKNDMLIGALNLLGLDFSAIGNHEFDAGTAEFAKRIENANFKYVATNLDVEKTSEIYPQFQKQKIVESWIANKNGHTYGFIGAMPTDLKERTKKNCPINGVEVENLGKTIEEIQEEIDKLKAKGVNKIILLSHLGNSKEVKLAKSVSGLDVIIGGHTHDLLTGIKDDVNLVDSKTGEPVVITQAGKDANYFGILNLIFDSNGVIKSAFNKVNKTIECKKSPEVEKLKDKIFGKAVNIGTLAQRVYPQDTLKTENPIASFIADAMKEKSGAQIVFLTSGGIRGELESGNIADRDVRELIPFNEKLHKVEVSEKELIDALENGAKSTRSYPYKPGLLQVSGLKYTIDKDKKIKEVFLANPNGSFNKIDSKNPNPFNKYTVVIDDFLISGPEGFSSMKKKDNIIESYSWDKADATIEYIKKLGNKSFSIEKTGRIVTE